MVRDKCAKNGKKLSGAVLIMVVAVMFVLIIMLLATLTVVSTAQNRYYTKFEENQAYYTARSALDVFTQDIITDDKYYAYDASGSSPRTYKYTTVDMSKTATEKAAAQSADISMKQGLAMEFEMYKIPAQNDAGLASNINKSDKIFGETSEIAEDTNYTIDSALDKDIGITYKITFPKIASASGYSNDYGKFVDVDPSTSEQEATIKVTVVNRRYNFGGANAEAFNKMTDAQLKTCSASSVTITDGGTTTVYTKAQLMEAIRLGDRLKDKMRIRLEATVNFMDTTGTAVLYYDTSEKPAVNSSNAITAVGGASAGDGIIPIGGVSSMSGGLTTRNNTNMVGSAYIIGDLFLNNTCDIYWFDDTVYTIRGNLNTGNSTNMHYIDAGAIIYVDGTFSWKDAIGWGAFGKEINLIAKVVDISSNAANGDSFYGNIYCDVFSDTEQTENLSLNGKIYTNYLTLTSDSLDGGDIHWIDEKIIFDSSAFSSTANKITIAKGFIYNGIKYNFLTGNYSMVQSESDSKLYTLESVPGFNCNATSEVKIGYNNVSNYKLTSDMHKEFTLPANLAGKTDKKITLPTSQSSYGEIFKPTAFVNDSPDTGLNGDLNSISMPTLTVTPDYATVSMEIWGTTQTMTHPEFGDMILDGTINDSNYGTPAYYGAWDWATWYYDSELAKKAYNDAVEVAKTDTAYQQALANYYANYITGAEKSGSSSTSLYEYNSTKIVQVNAPDMTDPEIASVGSDIEGVISIGGCLQSDTNYSKQYGTYSKPVIIDARASDIVIQLGAEKGSGTNQEKSSSSLTFKGVFVIIGEHTVKFYLPDGREYHLGDSGYDFAVYNYDIWHDRVAAIGTTKLGNLRLGDDSNATKSPNVFMYAGNDVSKITAHRNFMFTGYIYAPFSDFEFNIDASAGQLSTGIYYNNTEITTMASDGLGIVGSVICKNYYSGNNIGVAYINPHSSSYMPGDPQFQWKAYQYARN